MLNRMWLVLLGTVLFLGLAVVTLRAAEQGARPTGAVTSAAAPAVAPVKQHPPAAAPEDSATIVDDPTTAPDPSQSADNNVSFPTDI